MLSEYRVTTTSLSIGMVLIKNTSARAPEIVAPFQIDEAPFILNAVDLPNVTGCAAAASTKTSKPAHNVVHPSKSRAARPLPLRCKGGLMPMSPHRRRGLYEVWANGTSLLTLKPPRYRKEPTNEGDAISNCRQDGRYQAG